MLVSATTRIGGAALCSCGLDFCFHFGLGQGWLVLRGQTVSGGEQLIHAIALQFGAQHALDGGRFEQTLVPGFQGEAFGQVQFQFQHHAGIVTVGRGSFKLGIWAEVLRTASLRLEHQFLPVRSNFDLFTRLKLSTKQLRRERVEQVFLNRAFERAGAELRVVAFAGEQLLRGGIHVEREILLREALFQSPELSTCQVFSLVGENAKIVVLPVPALYAVVTVYPLGAVISP